MSMALDSEGRRESKRQRRKEARQRGVRLGTVSDRWRDGRRLPDLRLTSRWLEVTGFRRGREYDFVRYTYSNGPPSSTSGTSLVARCTRQRGSSLNHSQRSLRPR